MRRRVSTAVLVGWARCTFEIVGIESIKARVL